MRGVWCEEMGMEQPIPRVTAEVVARVVRREFAAAHVAEAERLLGLYMGREADRVRLAALREAGGRLDALADRIRLANTDYRDVLVAECARAFRLPLDADDAAMREAIEADWLEYCAWAGLGEEDRAQ